MRAHNSQAMFIDKDDRLSRAAPPKRGGWDSGWQERPPRDWRRPLRLAVYLLLLGLGGLALLAALALWLFPVQRTAVMPAADLAVRTATELGSPAVPAGVSNLAIAPPQPSIPPVAGVQGKDNTIAGTPLTPSSALPAVTELRAEIRDAAATLAAIRAQAEQARADLANLRLHAGSAPQVTGDHLPLESARPIPSAPMPPREAPSNPTSDAAAWSEAERVVQALARHTPMTAASAQQSPLERYAVHSPAAANPIAAPLNNDGDAAPDPPPVHAMASTPHVPSSTLHPVGTPSVLGTANSVIAAARPRVFIRFPEGSVVGQRLANDIARRLLFSDFAFTDALPMQDGPAQPTVRFFHREDAAMAQHLAALLGGLGIGFVVQDLSSFPAGKPIGALDVWLPS